MGTYGEAKFQKGIAIFMAVGWMIRVGRVKGKRRLV